MRGLAIKRKELKMSQTELAKIINVSMMTVSRWERGEQDPSIDTLKKLSEIFRCTVDDLISDVPNPMQRPAALRTAGATLRLPALRS